MNYFKVQKMLCAEVGSKFKKMMCNKEARILYISSICNILTKEKHSGIEEIHTCKSISLQETHCCCNIPIMPSKKDNQILNYR